MRADHSEPEVTRIAAYGVVRQEDRILLCHLTNSKRWTLPGGGLDFGEHPEVGMIREVLEETGMIVEPGKLLGIHSYTKHNPEDDFQCIQIVYSTVMLGGALKKELNGSTDDCAWIQMDAIGKMSIVPLVAETLNKYL